MLQKIKVSAGNDHLRKGLGGIVKHRHLTRRASLGSLLWKEEVGGIAELLDLLRGCLPSHTCHLYISIFLLRQPIAAPRQKLTGTPLSQIEIFQGGDKK